MSGFFIKPDRPNEGARVNVKALDAAPRNAWQRLVTKAAAAADKSWVGRVLSPLASAQSQAAYAEARPEYGGPEQKQLNGDDISTDIHEPAPTEPGQAVGFGGAVSMGQAVGYVLAADRAARLVNLVTMYQSVVSNIASSPSVADTGSAIAAAADELRGLMVAAQNEKAIVGDTMGGVMGPAVNVTTAWLRALAEGQRRGDRSDLPIVFPSWLRAYPKPEKPVKPWKSPALRNGSPASDILARAVDPRPKSLKALSAELARALAHGEQLQWGTPAMRAEFKSKGKPDPAPVDAQGRIVWGYQPNAKAAPAFDPDEILPGDGPAQMYSKFLSQQRRKHNRPRSWL
jgi:hypothetical protein